MYILKAFNQKHFAQQNCPISLLTFFLTRHLFRATFLYQTSKLPLTLLDRHLMFQDSILCKCFSLILHCVGSHFIGWHVGKSLRTYGTGQYVFAQSRIFLVAEIGSTRSSSVVILLNTKMNISFLQICKPEKDRQNGRTMRLRFGWQLLLDLECDQAIHRF